MRIKPSELNVVMPPMEKARLIAKVNEALEVEERLNQQTDPGSPAYESQSIASGGGGRVALLPASRSTAITPPTAVTHQDWFDERSSCREVAIFGNESRAGLKRFFGD